ncbi:hypothetical protein BFP72_04510 [Reichenbachiella sp. 5M10]|nr:hypothetical protein BFP72_04510 [Reichenbachiella sp. 5M10]
MNEEKYVPTITAKKIAERIPIEMAVSTESDHWNNLTSSDIRTGNLVYKAVIKCMKLKFTAPWGLLLTSWEAIHDVKYTPTACRKVPVIYLMANW